MCVKPVIQVHWEEKNTETNKKKKKKKNEHYNNKAAQEFNRMLRQKIIVKT